MRDGNNRDRLLLSTRLFVYLRRAVVHVIVEIFGIRDVESQYRGYRGYYTEDNGAEPWPFVQEQHHHGRDREQLRVYSYMMRMRETLESGERQIHIAG